MPPTSCPLASPLALGALESTAWRQRVNAHGTNLDLWGQAKWIQASSFLPPARRTSHDSSGSAMGGAALPLGASLLCLFLLPAPHSTSLHFCALNSHFPNKVLTLICFGGNSNSSDFRKCNFPRGLIQNHRLWETNSSLEINCGCWGCTS